MPWQAFLVEDEYCVFLLDEDDNRTGSSLGCHETQAEANEQIAALNAAEAEEETRDKIALGLFSGFWSSLKGLWVKERTIVDVDSWDGSPSRWPSTESYCNSCLINLNEGPPEDWIQSNCKLPVRNPGDSPDTFVRQAVFAAAARFNQVEAPEAEKEAARLELLKAYDEMGEEPPEALTRALSGSMVFDALWQRMFDLDAQIEGSDHYLIDMYFDESQIYALYVDRGKLYRYQLQVVGNEVVLGERQQVTEVHQPVEMQTVIKRQADGQYRWFSVSGTAVLNRSGDIDSRELFDSFVAYAEETGEYPIRQFFHQGEAYRTGQADFLARDGFCYITSGLYDDTPLAQVEVQARQNNPDFWGDSIGFIPTEEPELSEVADGIKIPVYSRGINKEISTLPETEAAHLFTARTEVTRMALDERALPALIQMFIQSGQTEEDALAWLEANPAARNRAIEQAGMITRDGEGDDDPSDDDTEDEFIIDDSVIDAVMGSEVFTQLSDRLTQVETQLTEQPEVVQVSEVEELRSVVSKLTKRLEVLEKGEAIQQQQLDDDKPAKFKRNGKRVTFRPRTANGNEQEVLPLNERAMANMPKGVSY